MEKPKLLMIIALGIISIMGLSYGYIQYKGMDINFNNMIKPILIIGGIAFCGYGIYWAIQYFANKNNNIKSPKEFVDSEDVIKIWQEKFMDAYEVDHGFDENNNKYPKFKQDIEIMKTLKYSSAGIPYFLFNVFVRSGIKIGLHCVNIRTDLGKQYIEKNWRERTTYNLDLKFYNPEHRKFPLATPEEDNMRMAQYKSQLLEDFKREDVEDFLRPYDEKPKAEQKEEEKPKIKKKEVNKEENIGEDDNE